MTAPRLEIDLDKVCHNARTLVDRLAGKGITVTGVTKATLGSPSVARAMRRGGVVGLADSRVENLARLRLGQDSASEEGSGPLTLLRSPMGSQIEDVVQTADVSCNTVERLELVIEYRLREITEDRPFEGRPATRCAPAIGDEFRWAHRGVGVDRAQ